MTKPLRQAMPETAAFIDAMREAFGPENINPSIKAGIDGQPTFWARENGQEIGTRFTPPPERTITMADVDIGPGAHPQPRKTHLEGKDKWTT